MTRHQTYAGILDVGLQSMLMTLEASRQAARTLRDEAQTDSEQKAAYRFVATVLDEIDERLKDAQANLDDLQLGASRAK